MNDFADTYPVVPHRMDEATIARLRAAEGHVTDEVDDAMDAALNYESEDGRYATPAEDAAFIAGICAACIALVALAGYAYIVLSK